MGYAQRENERKRKMIDAEATKINQRTSAVQCATNLVNAMIISSKNSDQGKVIKDFEAISKSMYEFMLGSKIVSLDDPNVIITGKLGN